MDCRENQRFSRSDRGSSREGGRVKGEAGVNVWVGNTAPSLYEGGLGWVAVGDNW